MIAPKEKRDTSVTFNVCWSVCRAKLVWQPCSKHIDFLVSVAVIPDKVRYCKFLLFRIFSLFFCHVSGWFFPYTIYVRPHGLSSYILRGVYMGMLWERLKILVGNYLVLIWSIYMKSASTLYNLTLTTQKWDSHSILDANKKRRKCNKIFFPRLILFS